MRCDTNLTRTLGVKNGSRTGEDYNVRQPKIKMNRIDECSLGGGGA